MRSSETQPAHDQTLGRMLADASRRWGTRPALVDGTRTLSYAELGERAAKVANGLGGKGLRPGDRVGVFLDDHLEAVEVFVGCALAGFTLVPVNARFRAQEVAHVLEDSGARALVYASAFAEVVDETGCVPDVQAAVCIGTAGSAAGALDYERLLATASAASPQPEISSEDIAIIGYTSGTTGKPKGALCSHRAITNCTQVVPYVQGLATNGVCVFNGSFSFVSALWGILFPHLWTGATVHLVPPSAVDEWVDVLARTGATFAWVPSPLVADFADELRKRPDALARLQSVSHAGSKVPKEHLASLVDVVGDRLVEAWGMTESVGPLTAITRADLRTDRGADDLLSSAGRPVPTAEVGVLGPDGGVTGEAGVVGELCARGDTMFSGYLGQRRDDPDTYTSDGWFRTGDIGRRDDAGYYYIEDRAKDVIVSGGMNVYPAEVELCIQTMPGVVECAVYGMPHDRWGETVVAAVVAGPSSAVDADAVIGYVRDRLASYKKPTRVRFVDALPRNASLKVQKHILKAGPD